MNEIEKLKAELKRANVMIYKLKELIIALEIKHHEYVLKNGGDE